MLISLLKDGIVQSVSWFLVQRRATGIVIDALLFFD
jgi:hypothetical protein